MEKKKLKNLKHWKKQERIYGRMSINDVRILFGYWL